MVKPYWHSKERYETARECIEAQLKKYVVTDCYYWFLDNGGCCTQVWDAAVANTATPEEMLDIAVEHFKKYGEVVFEGLAEKGKNPIVTIGCWDENAYGCKCF